MAQARQSKAGNFGDLHIEGDAPEGIAAWQVIVVLDPQTEEEMHRSIEATGGPLAWDPPGSDRNLWHRARDIGNVSLHMNLPSQPTEPVIDPVAGRFESRRREVGAQVRDALAERIRSSFDIADADVPRAVETLMDAPDGPTSIEAAEQVTEEQVVAVLDPQPL